MSRTFCNSTEKIRIIYADQSLIVVNKPHLLLSVPGRGIDKQDCLISRLSNDYHGILTVHRLDWETSGLTVLALNKEVHRHLSRQFQERRVAKQYTAIIYGQPKSNRGEINLPLRCDWENRPLQIVDQQQGKSAQTFWKLLSAEDHIKHYAHSKRILLMPITGRSHQLRVHMQAIGHPIIGDPLYAHKKALSLAPRLLLHATFLEFEHPENNTRIHFSSPPPF